MKVTERPSLEKLNTFGVQATAALRIDIESEEDILTLPAFDESRDLVLGGGSNVLLVTDVPGSVFVMRIRGREIVTQDANHVVVETGGGEDWHQFVTWTVQQGFSGIENLALIPGCAGAAPIQNIGAYGVELASVVESVTAWDFHRQRWRVFTARECRFAYRDSIFKSTHPGRYLISSLRLKLNRQFQPQVSYQGLERELQTSGTGEVTQKSVFDAVVRIRERKLPSPEKIGNAGSFFKNPVVTTARAGKLMKKYTGLPGWAVDQDHQKLSAAWMIEHCGLKGLCDGPVGVSDQHALVLVNHGDGSGQQLLDLAMHVQNSVEKEFGIRLEPEPRIVKFK